MGERITDNEILLVHNHHHQVIHIVFCIAKASFRNPHLPSKKGLATLILQPELEDESMGLLWKIQSLIKKRDEPSLLFSLSTSGKYNSDSTVCGSIIHFSSYRSFFYFHTSHKGGDGEVLRRESSQITLVFSA